jgi:hypothetical protein
MVPGSIGLTDEELAALEAQQGQPEITTGLVDRLAASPAPAQGFTDRQLDALPTLASTPFARERGIALPPEAPAEPEPMTDYELNQLEEENYRRVDYIMPQEEFRQYWTRRTEENNEVGRFIEGVGQGAAGMLAIIPEAGREIRNGMVGMVTDPVNQVQRNVQTGAETIRKAGINMVQLFDWVGNKVDDATTWAKRRGLKHQALAKRLEQEGKLTGDELQDANIIAAAASEADAMEPTPVENEEDFDKAYDRYQREKSLEQEFAGVTDFQVGASRMAAPATSKEAYQITNEQPAETLSMIGSMALDPVNLVPLGAGALSKLRVLRRTATLAGAPLRGVQRAADATADLAERMEFGISSRVQDITGLTAKQQAALGAGAAGAAVYADAAGGGGNVTAAVTALGSVLPGLRYGGAIIRKTGAAAGGAATIIREAGVGGIGTARAEAAADLARMTAIPERYRKYFTGYVDGTDSTLKRVAQDAGNPEALRRVARFADRAGVTTAARLADDVTSGAVAAGITGAPFAALQPDAERAGEVFGGIMALGGVGGLVGGAIGRRSTAPDADVARMMADVYAVGGNVDALSVLPHASLDRMAAMQGVLAGKVDFVPLKADEYRMNKDVSATGGELAAGLFLEKDANGRARVFINLDARKSAGGVGAIVPHEIGHAILTSNILDGQPRNDLRNLVNQQYGADGVQARGREYVGRLVDGDIQNGTTGELPQVLTEQEFRDLESGNKSPSDIAKGRKLEPSERERLINERYEELSQRSIERGEDALDWARDEVIAETFASEAPAIDFRGIRRDGAFPRLAESMLAAGGRVLEVMGVRLDGGTGKMLDNPSVLFRDNPLFQDRIMQKRVKEYVRAYDQYLVGLEEAGSATPRGVELARSSRPEDMARSTHVKLRDEGRGVLENDFLFQKPDGTYAYKPQPIINAAEANRAAQIKTLYDAKKFVPVNSTEFGKRKVNGREVIGGPVLPPQFDLFTQFPQHVRQFARGMEASRAEGGSWNIDYNAIGTGSSGRYRITNMGAVRAIQRETVPFGWQVTKQNHLLAASLDLNAFRASSMRAINKGELGIFNNDMKQVEADLKTYLANHRNGRPGEMTIGQQKRDTLNGLIGTGTAVQRAANPLYAELNPRGSIRTWRIDRLNDAQPSGRTGYFFDYDKINNNRMPQQIPRGAQGMPDVGYSERADIPLNERARRAAFVGSDGRVVSTNKRTHFETNEDLGPDFLAIGAGSISEDGFFRFGSDTMDNPMGETPSESRAAAARHNREVYDSGRRPSELLEDPPGLERGGAQRGQAMPDALPEPIEDSARKIHAVYDKSLLAKDRDSALYPKNPVPGSVVLPPRYGLVGNAPGMPRNFTEVRELVKLLADRVEDTGRRDVPFAQKSARFYSDMANEAVSLAEIVDPQSAGTARFNRADEMLRYLALGSQRTNVPVNSTKSAGAAASVVGDFTAGYKMGFGDAQRATRQAQADFKEGKHFNLDTKGVQDKVRTFYINGLSELIEVARKAGDTAAVEMLEARAAKSLKLVDPNAPKLTPEQLKETERILAGKATIDMWDMAAKRVAVPGFILDPKKRVDLKQPFEWTQKTKAAKDTIGSPRWSKVTKELGINSPAELRYQQARSLGIEGNFDWTAETWKTRVDSGAPFAGGDFTTYTGSTDAGLSPGGGGRLYDAQQAIDGLLADELNRRGLAPMFGKDKLFARNAQEILWAIEKKDNPIQANNDLSLFGDSIQPLKQELEAIADRGGQRNIRGAQVLDAMERAYTAMAKQEVPFEVATVGTGRTAAAINNALAAMKAAGDPDPLARITAHYANNLADELTGLATEHGMKLQVDSVKTDLGGFTMDDGSYTETPQITAVIRGNTGDTNYLMQVVNEAVEQQGGNLFRRPSVKELYDPAVDKQPVVSFETSQMTTAQRTAFVTDLAKIRDDKGDRIFTGYTPSDGGVFIGGQFYNGDFAVAVDGHDAAIRSTMKKHGVSVMSVEDMVVPSYRSSDPVAPSAFRDAVQKLFYDKAVSGISADAPTSVLQPANVAANLQSRLQKNEAMFSGRDNLDALAKAINESGSMSADQALARVGQTMEIPGAKKMQAAFSDYVRGNRKKYDALPAADKKSVSEYIKQAREAAKAMRDQEVAFSRAAKEGIRSRRSEIADRYDPQRALDEIDAASLLGYLGNLETAP